MHTIESKKASNADDKKRHKDFFVDVTADTLLYRTGT